MGSTYQDRRHAKRKALRYGLPILCLLLIAAAIVANFYLKNLGPLLKSRVVHALEDRFDADVDLKSLDVQLFPLPRVAGTQLSIRHKQWTDPHPLIYIRSFLAETDFSTILDLRNRVNLVRLDGLEIHIPPRGRATLSQGMEKNAEPGRDTTQFRFLIAKLVADGALLEIEPKIPGKDPLRFEIQKLLMRSVGPGQAMAFTAKLNNAKPPGLIDSNGHFGPWQRDDPRSTAVSGDYTFQNADLSVFKGISGTLASKGDYRGVLQHIDVDGTTDTPNFALKQGGDPVHLATRFHSAVDGTNGDTLLDPVDATFLQSEMICRGSIVRQPGDPAKTVSLDATTKHGRIEDILKLVVGGKTPFVTGNVNFTTKILIPPGKQDVLDKLRLNGQFGLISATFTSAKVEQRLRTLSNRARGITKAEEDARAAPPQSVASNLSARFRLDRGTASFQRLSFNVPGALIKLTGAYNLSSGKIDMRGTFGMQATLSETQSGVKHWLLKPFDPLFKKNGEGFEVPIDITGTTVSPILSATVFHRKFDIH